MHIKMILADHVCRVTGVYIPDGNMLSYSKEYEHAPPLSSHSSLSSNVVSNSSNTSHEKTECVNYSTHWTSNHMIDSYEFTASHTIYVSVYTESNTTSYRHERYIQ